MNAFFCTVLDLSDDSTVAFAEWGKTKTEAAAEALQTRQGDAGGELPDPEDYSVFGESEWNLEDKENGYQVVSVYSIGDLESMLAEVRKKRSEFSN